MLELVTDRTAADVKRWRQLQSKGYEAMTEAERTEWDSGMKGAYNITDLNRVGNALKYLQNRLSVTGYLQGYKITPKTDWNVSDVPTAADFTAYIRSVNSVREALTMLHTTPEPLSETGGIGFQDANDIEQILTDTEYLLNQLQAMYHYYGDIYCGEI